jgi:uncharacterized membrane protein
MIRGLWGGAVLLVVIGVGSAGARGYFRADFAARLDPLRQQVLEILDRKDPDALQRAAELDRFDRRFATHPVSTILHVLPGGIFLVLALLQFSPRIRSRHIQFHRYVGRILMVVGFLAALTGLYFGILVPYGGPGETAIILLVGGLFLAALIRAFVAIRRKQVSLHREWMIRAVAIAIGVSTVRVVGAVLDVALSPVGVGAADVFVLSLWVGWGITLGAAELWIRYTRRHRDAPIMSMTMEGENVG